MYKHYSQAGWVAIRKQFHLIHSILFGWKQFGNTGCHSIMSCVQAEIFQPFSWFLHLARPRCGGGGAVEEPLPRALKTLD